VAAATKQQQQQQQQQRRGGGGGGRSSSSGSDDSDEGGRTDGDGDSSDGESAVPAAVQKRHRNSSTGAALALKASVQKLAQHPALPAGALVWVKLGEWPWWPAQLRDACAAPDALLAAYLKGQVLVMFFGEPDDNKWNWLPFGAVRPWGGRGEEGVGVGGSGSWSHAELKLASKMLKFQRAVGDAEALAEGVTRVSTLQSLEARQHEARSTIAEAGAAEDDEDEPLSESAARLRRTKAARTAMTELKGRLARLRGAANVAVSTADIF